MSKRNDKPSGEKEIRTDEDWPDGVEAPPPITLPTPDGLAEPNQQREVNQERARKKKKEKRSRKNKRNHPSDPYKPLKNKKNCGCGCGCLFLILLILGLIGGGFYFTIAPFQAGYELYEHQENQLLTVEEAPEKPTLYMGNEIVYKAPDTSVTVAFVGANVSLSGYFSEKVSFRGYKLTITEDSVFLNGLEVYAVEFNDEGAKINGDLTGQIVTQKNAE